MESKIERMPSVYENFGQTTLNVGEDEDGEYNEADQPLDEVTKQLKIGTINRDLELIRQVLQNNPNIDINRPIKYNTNIIMPSVLFLVMTYQGQSVALEILKEFLNQPKIDVNAREKKHEMTASMIACRLKNEKHSLEILQKLVESKNTDLNMQDKHGMTALHHAASKDKYEVVKWLIQKENVEQNIRTQFNELAIDVCSSKNGKNIINYLKNFMTKTPSSQLTRSRQKKKGMSGLFGKTKKVIDDNEMQHIQYQIDLIKYKDMDPYQELQIADSQLQAQRQTLGNFYYQSGLEEKHLEIKTQNKKDKVLGEYNYLGQFLKGSKYKQGAGKAVYSDGMIYEGYWKDDLKHGKGRWINKDGRVYDGMFKHDLKHGLGKQTFSNGDVYTGEFYKNKRQGRGIQINKNGTTIEGIFQNDNQIKAIIKPDGQVVKVNWQLDENNEKIIME